MLSHVSENFLPTKGSTSKGGVVKLLSGQVPGIGSQSTQNIILLWLTGNCGAMLAAKLSLRRKVQSKNISNSRSTREACPRLQKANRRKYHSCCSGNCWWQCCALQSINGTGESLYPARLPILSPGPGCSKPD